MTILVTAIGSFAADIVIKKLKEQNHRVIGLSVYPKAWTAESYMVDAFYKVPYAEDETAFREAILQICERESVNIIIPLTDAEVDTLTGFREKLTERKICVAMPDNHTLAICRNKDKIAAFIRDRELSVQTIKTERLSGTKKVDTWPVVCKPESGRSSHGLHIVESEEALSLLRMSVNINEYIVQPYIVGQIVTVDVIRDPVSGRVIALPRRELLRTVNGAGTTVQVFCDPMLEAQCAELVNALGIRGCVNFEFIQNMEGQYYFLECNPRFSGGIEFSCMSGYDFISNHIRCFTGEEIEVETGRMTQIIARKYEEYITQTDT